MTTVADIVKALEARSRSAELSRFDGLLPYQLAALEDAVRRLRPDADVDVRKLLRQARDAQSPDQGGRPFNYFFRIATLPQLHAMRTALKDGSSPAEAMAAAISMGRPVPTPRRIETTPARMEQPKEQRSGVARYRGKTSGLRPRKRREPAPMLTGRIIGRGDPDRPRGMSVDWDPNAAHPPPPWEHDEE